MLRFATVGLTASKMVKFQRKRSIALFVWPHQLSRRYMSNDDAHEKGLTEGCKDLTAHAGVIEALKAGILCTPDPVIKKLFASVLKSVEIYRNNEEAEAKLGSDSKENSGLKPSGITTVIACESPIVNAQGSYSLTELKKSNLLNLWDMMKIAGRPNADFPELQQVYGLKSATLLRDLFLSFRVTLMEFSMPFLVELDQSEWNEKIRNWSEGDGGDLFDLTGFRCMQVFDLEIKRLNLISLTKKKFGFDDLGDFFEICQFAQTWRNVSSVETRRLGMYYVAHDEGVANSGFKFLDFFGIGGSSSSTRSIDSDLMQFNALKIAVSLS